MVSIEMTKWKEMPSNEQRRTCTLDKQVLQALGGVACKSLVWPGAIVIQAQPSLDKRQA